jgi:TadE-like protein
MMPFTNHEEGERRRSWLTERGCECAGGVALEFSIVAPLILMIITAIADIGLFTTRAVALAGATRIGAEYARLHPADTVGIQNAMSSYMSFNPPLTFPSKFSETCECADQIAIACMTSCAAVGRSGPNRVFMRISAAQGFSPLLPLPGLPGTLTSAMEIRLQ